MRCKADDGKALPAAYVVAAQNDLKVVQQYCTGRFEAEGLESQDEIVATLEAICANSNAEAPVRAVQFGLLVHYKEARVRRRQSHSPYNATSVEYWHCRFVPQELKAWQDFSRQWLALQPESPNAVL